MFNFLFFFAAVLSAFYSLSPVFVIEWAAYKLVPVFILLVIMITARQLERKYYASAKRCLILIAYMVGVTGVAIAVNLRAGHFEYAINEGAGVMRAHGHMLVQLVSMVLLIWFFPLVRRLKNPRAKYLSFVNGFLSGCFISASAGIAAYIFILENIDIFAIFGLKSFEMSHSRLGGLSGEPRHLGAVLAVGIFVMLSEPNAWYNKRPLRKWVYWAVTLIALFGTLSTSAWIGVVFGLAAYLIAPKGFVPVSRKIVKTKAILIMSGIIAAIFAGTIAKGVFEERFISRVSGVSEVMYFLPKDSISLDYMMRTPVVGLFGVGAGGIDYRLLQHIHEMEMDSRLFHAHLIHRIMIGDFKSSLTPSTFLIRWLADFGLVGAVLLFSAIRSALREMRGTNEFATARSFILMGAPASTALSSIGIFILFYIFALSHAAAMCNVRKEQSAKAFHQSNGRRLREGA